MHEVKQFKTHLERLGYSTNMVNQLPEHVRDFLAFTGKPAGSVRPGDVLRYYRHLNQRPNKKRPGGLSESYIHHHIYSLKLYFAWQMESGRLFYNPLSTLSFPRPHVQPREILTQQEVREMYAVTETCKERAVLGVFYGCGLRRTEGEQLNLKDIHFRSRMLYVREGKSKKRRVVPMSGQVSESLQEYVINERFSPVSKTPGGEFKGEAAFITNTNGRRENGSNYNKIVRALLDRAGIGKTITLHCLRHSIATHLLENGLPVEYVRDFLGHEHLETTQIYTRVNKRQIFSLSGSETPLKINDNSE